ncbi:MAG TPA: sec-independent translocase [Jiangellaceae bacterium]|nr:sec-independent translocase [Jiangellaceae bacterium]
MFDIGAPEVLVVLIVALLVFGPDRLPEMARQAGSWMRDLRRMVANARRDLSDELGVDAADLSKLRNLDPKSYVRRNVLDGVDLDLGLDDDGGGRPRRGNGIAKPRRKSTARSGRAAAPPGVPTSTGGTAETPGAAAAPARPAPAPFDPDTT